MLASKKVTISSLRTGRKIGEACLFHIKGSTCLPFSEFGFKRETDSQLPPHLQNFFSIFAHKPFQFHFIQAEYRPAHSFPVNATEKPGLLFHPLLKKERSKGYICTQFGGKRCSCWVSCYDDRLWSLERRERRLLQNGSPNTAVHSASKLLIMLKYKLRIITHLISLA